MQVGQESPVGISQHHQEVLGVMCLSVVEDGGRHLVLRRQLKNQEKEGVHYRKELERYIREAKKIF